MIMEPEAVTKIPMGKGKPELVSGFFGSAPGRSCIVREDGG